MNKLLTLTSALLFASVTVACGGSSGSSDKSAETNLAPGTGNVVPSTETPVTPVIDGGSVNSDPAVVVAPPKPIKTLSINASSYTAWIYLDLETGALVPEGDASWDLAFQRMNVKLNGAADVEALNSNTTNFDAFTTVPAEGYVTDAATTTLAAELFFTKTGEEWYAYDMTLHTLSSKNFVYVVKSNTGLAYKLSFLDYYDDLDGKSGYPKIKFQELAAPVVTAAAE